MFYPSVRSSWIVAILLASLSSITAKAETTIEFTQQIQPILAEHCIVCHGQDKTEAGLRLDRPETIQNILDSGAQAIVPGKPEKSELVRRIIDRGDERMPPEGPHLTDDEVTAIRRWIQQGANWPRHWAYLPLDRTPRHPRPSEIRHAVDWHVQSEWTDRSLAFTPSPPANRNTLIRRLYLDLLGLPPSIKAISTFVNDQHADAYERLVDRVLASPQFGERWGRHWLDKARYADSDGYEKDRPRPDAWRYRDWVLAAVNEDLSFDQFTIQQLAGDLLPKASDNQLLATAFHRQTLTNTEGGTDKEQWRVAAVMDRTETLGTIWLGHTVGCARCHSHKYDAITQREYYQLFAYFNNADETRADIALTPAAQRDYEAQRPTFELTQARLEQTLDRLSKTVGKNREQWEQNLRDQQTGDVLSQTDRELIAVLQLPENQRSNEQKIQLTNAYEDIVKQVEQAKKALEKHQQQVPPERMSVRVVKQRAEEPRTTNILRRGEFKEPLEPVEPATLTLMSSVDSPPAGSRVDLAEWLIHEDNSLVARVVANHVWQNLFGIGLVRTPNDFGVRGDAPSMPRLLDHLASEYQRRGWSRKNLIRHIVTSHTYQQASVHRRPFDELDPQNEFLTRQNRFRVEAEIVRDLALAVSGLLSAQIGGASVFPPMPPEVAEISYANNFKWSTSQGSNRYRRGLYTFFKRTSPHPTLITFDCPDANTTNVMRNRSNTPLAALTLLNNEVYTEAAAALADELLQLVDGTDQTRLKVAIQRCLTREPSAFELTELAVLLTSAREYYQQHPDEAASIAQGPFGKPDRIVERAAWATTLRALLNLDEFITRE